MMLDFILTALVSIPCTTIIMQLCYWLSTCCSMLTVYLDDCFICCTAIFTPSRDSEKQEWTKEYVIGYRPRGRRSHCAISMGNNVLYFGGYNAVSKQHYGDLFLVNTGEMNNNMHARLQP